MSTTQTYSQRDMGRIDLHRIFRRWIQELTMLGDSDKARGAKLKGTSYRVINRWRHGQLPSRIVRLSPELLRALADDLEALRSSGDFDRVYGYILSKRGRWEVARPYERERDDDDDE